MATDRIDHRRATGRRHIEAVIDAADDLRERGEPASFAAVATQAGDDVRADRRRRRTARRPHRHTARSTREHVMRRCAALLLFLGLLVGGCGKENEPVSSLASEDPGPIHVHGLGIDPADESLFIATHTGLFRAPQGSEKAVRVTDRFQDTMGFTVVGANRFLGSGHPDGRESLPPFLGLIESRDAGRSWRAISLQGDADFHVLEASGKHVYGYGSDFETREPQFLTSTDGGRSWERREPPEALLSLAIAPHNADEIIASGEQRVWRSLDGGKRWRPVDAPGGGFLIWTMRGVFVIGLDGRAWHADSASGPFEATPESLDGQAAAADAGPEGELLVALHDGTIKQSDDAGRSWIVRTRP